VSLPRWLLWLISAEELVVLAVFCWERAWVDVIYWTGVLIVNVALILRAK